MITRLHPPLAWAVILVAAATGWAHAEGPGIRAGELLIHPDAFVQGAFDNNVFFDDTGETPESSSLLRAGVGVGLENRTPNKLSLEAGAGLSYRHYFESGEQFSARNTIDRANLNATVGFLPRSPITVEVHEDGNFRDNPAFDDTEFGFRMLDNSLGVDLRFRPGENPDSRPFELRLGYRWQSVNFIGDDADVLNTSVGEKDAHHLRFLTSWRFLPKTALLAEVGWTSLSYDEQLDVAVTGAGGQSASVRANRDAQPFFVLAGVKGLVTRRLSTTLKAGYKNTFNAEGSSFSSVIATAEILYAIEPALRASLGYNRDGRDTAFANYYTLNQVYGGVDFYFLGRWSVGGRVGFDHYAFSDDAGGVDRQGDTRTDPVLRGNVYAGFNPRDWMTVKLDVASQQNMSEFESGVAVNAEGDGLDPVAYSRQLVMLELQVNY
jgi:hypothetical protein